MEMVPHVQSALLLLRYCAVPSSIHSFRTIPPSYTCNHAITHDKLIRKCVQHLLKCEVNEEENTSFQSAWQQMTLPISKGGLGLMKMELLHETMYLSSWLEAIPIANQIGANRSFASTWYTSQLFKDTSVIKQTMNCIREKIDDEATKTILTTLLPQTPDNLLVTPFRYTKLQHSISDLLHDQTSKKLMNNVIGIENQIRLKSVASENALDWLKTIPSDPAMEIADDIFRIRLIRILGLPLSSIVHIPQKCTCGETIINPQQTNHFLICKQNRIQTHDNMVTEMKNMIRCAGLKCDTEILGVAIFPGRCTDSNLRVDLFSTTLMDARSTVGDVTIRNPFPTSSLMGTTNVIAQAEKSKNRKYKALCDEAGYKFETYAFDHYGLFSQDVKSVIKRMSKEAKSSYRDYTWSSPSFGTYWKQRLSCRLQKILGYKELALIKESNRAHSILPGGHVAQNADIEQVQLENAFSELNLLAA
jgi:hypothetical protein